MSKRSETKPARLTRRRIEELLCGEEAREYRRKIHEHFERRRVVPAEIFLFVVD